MIKAEKWFIFSNPIPPPNPIGFFKKKDKTIIFNTYQDYIQQLAKIDLNAIILDEDIYPRKGIDPLVISHQYITIY